MSEAPVSDKQTEPKPRRVGDGTPGPGRKPGVPNKTTAQLKEAILAAATRHGEDGDGEAGLEGYLFKVAREDVKAFAGLLGKVLPMQVAGDPSSPLHTVTRVLIEAAGDDGEG